MQRLPDQVVAWDADAQSCNDAQPLPLGAARLIDPLQPVVIGAVCVTLLCSCLWALLFLRGSRPKTGRAPCSLKAEPPKTGLRRFFLCRRCPRKEELVVLSPRAGRSSSCSRFPFSLLCAGHTKVRTHIAHASVHWAVRVLAGHGGAPPLADVAGAEVMTVVVRMPDGKSRVLAGVPRDRVAQRVQDYVLDATGVPNCTVTGGDSTDGVAFVRADVPSMLRGGTTPVHSAGSGTPSDDDPPPAAPRMFPRHAPDPSSPPRPSMAAYLPPVPRTLLEPTAMIIMDRAEVADSGMPVYDALMSVYDGSPCAPFVGLGDTPDELRPATVALACFSGRVSRRMAREQVVALCKPLGEVLFVCVHTGGACVPANGVDLPVDAELRHLDVDDEKSREALAQAVRDRVTAWRRCGIPWRFRSTPNKGGGSGLGRAGGDQDRGG